jgi:protease-4
MKTYAHIAAKLFGTPLLLHPPVLNNFGTVVAARMTGGEIRVSADDALTQERRLEPSCVAPFAVGASPRVQRITEQYGNVAVIYIEGAIDKALSDFEVECFGGVDLRDVDQALTLAENDDRITHVVLSMQTPGGSTIGVSDTAARIAQLTETKEVHAYCDTLCCSAGMWLASAADMITVSPSAIVGSIGVYVAVLDQSEAMAMDGIKVQLIQAGQFKTMGSSYKPLSESEASELQAGVNRTHAAFKAAITAKRAVPESAMEGQWYDGQEALSYGVVDAITNASLEEYVMTLIS